MINCKRYKRSLTHILCIVNLSNVFIWEGAHFYIAFRLTTWLSCEIIIYCWYSYWCFILIFQHSGFLVKAVFKCSCFFSISMMLKYAKFHKGQFKTVSVGRYREWGDRQTRAGNYKGPWCYLQTDPKQWSRSRMIIIILIQKTI